MALPLYKLVINEDDTDQTGVMAIALVDSPAIEMNWMAFAKQSISMQQFKTENAEKRIISGALMVAGQKIYRKDESLGEYEVMFDKETISKIVQKYFRQGNTSEVNMMHNESAKANGVYMIESFIIDKERGIQTPKGYDKLPDGSWFGSFKVDNQQIWDEFIKTGTFKGFSVEGFFNNVPVEMSSDHDFVMQKVKELLQNGTK
jgi:capsid protein